MSADADSVIIEVTRALADLGIDYLVGGSVASSVRGLARMTNDVDIVALIRAEDVQPLVARLSHDFYVDEGAVREAVSAHGSFNLIHLASIVKIDVFVKQPTEWADEEWRRRTQERIGSTPGAPLVYVASAEDIVLQKLRWFELGGGVSDRQWSDVLGVLRVQARTIDREYMRHWAGRLGLGPLLEQALAQAGGSTNTNPTGPQEDTHHG